MHVLSKSELGDIHELIDSNQKLLPTALIRLLEEQFPHLNTETLYSIFNHRLRNKCAVSGKRLQDEKVAASLYHAFKTRVKDNHSNKVRKSVIPELATERGFFPWMAFRTVLMKHLEERDGQPPSKKALQSILRSPHLLRDVQLQLESIHCSVQDQLQGVVTDCLRHAVGRDYEVILEQRLKEANIAFLDEDAQRQAGQDVTPDFRLHVPIGVGGQPVCWIDSKALFGDAESHQNYLNTQLLSYWNRFGPGLVIYWCGYEENIEQLAPEMKIAYSKPSKAVLTELQNAAHRIRIDSIESTTAAGSGHPSSCTSAADIMSVLFKRAMKYNVQDPGHASNDRFVLSKGHAAPALYAAWKEVGFLTEPLTNLRKLTSDLEGHPPVTLPFVDVATGSLGQGLSNAAGMAWIGKNLDKAPYRVYCLMGDGECAEGSVWEAMQFSSHYNLDNLCAIIDCNRLGQSEATALGHDVETYRKRGEAFGWNTLVIDGHNIEAIAKAFHEAETTSGQPTLIVAQTYKGKDMPEQEDRDNWHGKPMPKEACEKIVKHLNGLMEETDAKVTPLSPSAKVTNIEFSSDITLSPPTYKKSDKIATRKAYGTAMVKLGAACNRVCAFDGDTKNSTFSLDFAKAYPDRFAECFIAEQNLVGVAIGAACRNRAITFASTFAAFFSRAADQIRMGAISKTNANFVGSHAGVSIGEDGPSQMALEDVSFFRCLPGSTVFYPSDAVSCERAVELAANKTGICFIRTSRPATVSVYDNDHTFDIGKANFIKEGSSAAIFGSGITLHNALEAADLLAKEGIKVSVIDPFTIKPMDVDAVKKAVKLSGGKLVTVEDHYAYGGLHSAVSEVVTEHGLHAKVKCLAVPGVARSGKSAELMALSKIDAAAIVAAVKAL